MYKDDEYIKRVNKTYSKTFSQRQILSNYISTMFDQQKHLWILDYGAGKDIYGTLMLRDRGFKYVTAYDIGNNYVEGLHDLKALTKTYDIIFASNVINVQTSYEDIIQILQEVHSCMILDSEFHFNIPGKPRKCDLNNKKVIELLNEVFGEGNSCLIYGDTELEIYKCTKSES